MIWEKNSVFFIPSFLFPIAYVDNGSLLSNPLLQAIEHGNFDIALKLIAAGANPNQTLKYSISPIAIAAAQGAAEVIKALIAAGADANTFKTSSKVCVSVISGSLAARSPLCRGHFLR